MFGLSEHTASLTTTDMFPFPPVQIQDSVLLPLLSPSNVPTEPIHMLHIPSAPIPTQTYLPSLQFFCLSTGPVLNMLLTSRQKVKTPNRCFDTGTTASLQSCPKQLLT